jgi:hypothetical protein
MLANGENNGGRWCVSGMLETDFIVCGQLAVLGGWQTEVMGATRPL